MASKLRAAPLLSSVVTVLVSTPALAATWQEGVNYGGSTNMNLYVPDTLDPSPGVVVALHSCGNQYESDSQNYVKTSADQYGFIIIQPTNGSPDCWTSDAGQDGEKPNILAMVTYVLDNHDGDPNRVFAVGASSGACMTLALMATHPDVFSGGSVLAGVPYGAWRAGGSCTVCSQQPTAMSEDAWGNIVRQNAPANYAGPWPRIQLWHGTGDTTLLPGWLQESEKQWKNVHGLTGSGTSATGPAGWTRTEYSAEGAVVVQVNSGSGKDHYLPDDVPQADIVKFFGLDVDAAPGGDTSGEETGASSAPPTATSEGEDSTTTSATTTTTTTTSATTTTTTTSAPSTSDTTTPVPTTTATPPTPVTPTPVPPTATPTATPPAGSSSAPGTDTATSTETASTSAPTQTDSSSGEGCQCQLGAAGQSPGALAGLIAAGVATLLRRRNRRS